MIALVVRNVAIRRKIDGFATWTGTGAEAGTEAD